MPNDTVRSPKEGREEEARRVARELAGKLMLGGYEPRVIDGLRHLQKMTFVPHSSSVEMLEAALLSFARGEVEWQPIETAPKDGTRINLCWEAFDGLSAHVELGKWSSGAGWANTYGHSFSGSPDYWQPLPSPPAKHGEG